MVVVVDISFVMDAYDRDDERLMVKYRIVAWLAETVVVVVIAVVAELELLEVCSCMVQRRNYH